MWDVVLLMCMPLFFGVYQNSDCILMLVMCILFAKLLDWILGCFYVSCVWGVLFVYCSLCVPLFFCLYMTADILCIYIVYYILFIYIQQVSISPEVSSKKVCRDIMNELVTCYKVSHLGKRMLAYDGRKSCYTAGQLPFVSKEFNVKLVDKDGAR